MEKLHLPSDKILKQAITEIKEPVLFQGMLQDATGAYTWKLLEWDLPKLTEMFGNVKLPFRVGYNTKTIGPQWEVNCLMTSMTLSELLKNIDHDQQIKKWYYFDYKHMQEWFQDKPQIIDSVNWKRFGFEKTGSDSTLWIGSKGAHTNCHQDSYGCNLVAQIHGRKQWLLFPPSSSNCLQPTRVPYEESTVYSKYNFFCPTKEDEINILKIQDNARLITLEAGDVLFVPHGWWHYVESLEFSVSVNVWLPIITDNVSRVKEAIVKLIVARIGKNVQTSEETHCSLSYCMQLLSMALEECQNMENAETSHKTMQHNAWTAEVLAAQYPHYVKLLRELKAPELEEFLRIRRERFLESSVESLADTTSDSDSNIKNFSAIQKLSENIVNAICQPDVINKVADLLLSL
ncbi:PREDICTED: HSPB1-associated protein 1 [Dufourea novaeangliae]|uniref:HSPB1-associated protein 1 n=1 Tax=Dufourea novaeangliae TaxID=178035 RepID=A0A154P3K9_DUFNO|nr:PREDICTED: HSPB1-associated protein 1 [Dufourea novaeangliae]KZC06525.1 HSPB1-associated protein 1 [Dufourea novaeangliae]